MRVSILHPTISDFDSPDEKDILVQANSVKSALITLGHEVKYLPCDLDLHKLKSELNLIDADLVFNLVESLDGHGSLIHIVPYLLDTMKILYTGCSSEAILITSNKIFAKERLRAIGLPTPDWVGPYPARLPPLSPDNSGGNQRKWIVKSVWEHASIGMDETQPAFIFDSSDAAAENLHKLSPHFGGACFAERFIEGREFNISLLDSPSGPLLLSPAEILFEGYPPQALRIVGYRAKWDETSYEFHHTQRRYEFPLQDAQLISKMRELALQCWRLFGLGGYARVDFRVDEKGNPWILEVNTNPCLSPDAGFAAALNASNITFNQAIENIISGSRLQHGFL
jgi:D-alanine-D-alanine ligase